MDSSFEDVFNLLNKCWEEKTPLTVLVNAGDAVATVGGFVTDLSSMGVTISCIDSSGTKYAEAMVNFPMAVDFSFQDPREAPERLRESMAEAFDYVIQIRLASTTQCVIYVRRG